MRLEISLRSEPLASVYGTAGLCLYPISAFLRAKADSRQEVQLLSLLRQTDFADQFGVARIGAQGIELEVGPEGDQAVVCLLSHSKAWSLSPESA